MFVSELKPLMKEDIFDKIVALIRGNPDISYGGIRTNFTNLDENKVYMALYALVGCGAAKAVPQEMRGGVRAIEASTYKLADNYMDGVKKAKSAEWGIVDAQKKKLPAVTTA